MSLLSLLVDEKFREWTNGLYGKERIISVYEHIRDIPYSLAVPMSDPQTAPEQILGLGKGYCAPKHYLLAEMFRRLDYEVMYATFPFLWNDPDFLYTPYLRRLATGLPVAHHLARRVRIRDRRVLVDATWDSPLVRGGFPVNIHWDGTADTRCAVKPLPSSVRTGFCSTATNEPLQDNLRGDYGLCDGEKNPADAEVRERYYRGKVGIRTPEETRRVLRFNHELDAWLQSLRQPPAPGQGFFTA